MPSTYLACLLLFISSASIAAPRLEDIRLPPGFRISVYASGLEQARSLALGERGTLFVGTSAGTVYAVPPGGARAVVVARRGYAIHTCRVTAGGTCPECGTAIPGHWGRTAHPQE